MRVLIVEDEAPLRNGLLKLLREEGYAADAAANGEEGLRKAMECDYDAIVLDYLMPIMDGREMLRRLRHTKRTPIMMLTARNSVDDRVAGLDLGADDYVAKPFVQQELLARLRAVLRRSALNATVAAGAEAPPQEVVVGELRLNLDARSAALSSQPLTLTPVEFDLLASLAKARGRVKSRESLLDECRDRNYEVFDRSIDVHISALRRKLGDDAKEPRYIRTIRSAGYLLAGPE